MSVDVIRAWKDPEFRQNLSEADRMLLPAHPAGLIELTDVQLDSIAGGGAWDDFVGEVKPYVQEQAYYACIMLQSPLSDSAVPNSHEIQDSCAEAVGACGENVDGTYMTCK
jgi:mersacidin/lichenicidin family type 2 lantibiotic